ncbi:MAG: IclR family transcriptional regulator [Trueperaceae bacterium]
MSQALEKGVQLLGFVAEGDDTLPKLAKVSGWPKSTIHRLAAVLVEQGLLRYQDHRYLLGYRLLELSEKAKRQLSYLQVAKPQLEEVSRRTRETIHLGELAEGHIIYLEKIPGERGLQMRSHVGLRTPAQVTALGKVLIAHRPRAEWESHLFDLPPRTERSITDRNELLRELEAVRRQGYALDREENEPGTRCVAAPLWDSSGRIIAAISISGASIYIDEARQMELVPVALECARNISRNLGGGEAPRVDPLPQETTGAQESA